MILPSVKVFRLMAPRMFGAAVVQLMLWVNTLLASHMAGGSVFSLTSGFSLMIMAQAAIAQSVATAVMPTFSAQFAQGKLDDLRQTLASALRAVILLSVPATAGLILLSVPLITFLYQRGEFTADDHKPGGMGADLVRGRAGLPLRPGSAGAGLLRHARYENPGAGRGCRHDPEHRPEPGLCIRSFKQVGWMPHGGLALAVSVSTALEVTTLFLIMRERLNGIHGAEIASGFGVAALATLFMAAGPDGLAAADWHPIPPQ